jgi:hypothetical protein
VSTDLVVVDMALFKILSELIFHHTAEDKAGKEGKGGA